MPLTIDEVTSDYRYEGLSQEGKRKLRDRFLEQVVLKDERYSGLSDEGKSGLQSRLDLRFGIKLEPSLMEKAKSYLPSTETVKASLTFPEIAKTATEPMVRFAEKISPEKGGEFAKRFPVVSGGIRGGARALEGLTSPLNLGLLATGYGAPLAIKRAIAGGLAVEIGYELIKSAPDRYRNYKEALDKGDMDTATEIVTESGIDLGIVAGGGKFLVKPPVRPGGGIRTPTFEESMGRAGIERTPPERQLPALLPEPRVFVPPIVERPRIGFEEAKTP